MIEGFIEAIRPFQLRGWAYNPEVPEEALEVTLLVSGDAVLTISANMFRDDLKKSGKGDGLHGFVLNVDRPLPMTVPDEIQVQCRSLTGEIRTLPNVENAVITDKTVAVEAGRRSEPSITGYFRLSSPSSVSGWAYDQQQPNEHLKVDIVADDALIWSGVADEFRPDLIPAGIGKGDHGFTANVGPRHCRDISVIARAADERAGILQILADQTAASPALKWIEPEIPFPGRSRDQASHPVFVLGAARSGTSAIAQALVVATRYAGQEEGHLLDLLLPLRALIERHYAERSEEWRDRANTMIAVVPKGFIEAGLRHTFVELARGLYPKGWWIDKTPRPAMIAAAPALKEIWPEARFIFMKRRGIENVVSRMRKFREADFEDHCRDWAAGMQAWTVARDTLTGAAVEIDQLYLSNHPHEVAATLAPFLLLQPEEVIRLGHALATDRPERTTEYFSSAIPSDKLDWTPRQRDLFDKLCGPMMVAYGYGTGEEYYMRGREGSLLVQI
jgi:hypothetical protein